MNTYHAVYERDESGAWLVNIDEFDGCHSYGRNLAQAREHITEALAAWLDQEPTAFDIADVYRLPDRLRTVVDSAAAAQNRARQAAMKADAARAEAIDGLISAGLSLRDIASLVNLSHQRVAQVAQQMSSDRSAGVASSVSRSARTGRLVNKTSSSKTSTNVSARAAKSPVVVRKAASGQWEVKDSPRKKAVATYRTKKEAERAARQLAARTNSELVVRGERRH